ncbi:hypothetical protein K503DRAFT_777534 [Rhizopogon vinicolor AM-OR11-026]|uniref:Uncharacterized protein n=1 Tax=Rhizopogon vinicolor AM-OR11-026 TaxID=1314800 RepID=A0A1B7MFV1_9AGAM|nr:hypothetical protein K503DRAFT_777534 [Rhizopogon vinicolor AM-OR11-026]
MQVAIWAEPPITAPTYVKMSRGELRERASNLAASSSEGLGTTIRASSHRMNVIM